jgi:hypothetical protein
MLESHPIYAPLDDAARCNKIRDRIVLSLALCALIRTGGSLASDQPVVIEGDANSHSSPLRGTKSGGSPSGKFEATPRSPTLGAGSAQPIGPAPTVETPGDFTAPNMSDIKVFSDTDFRPRRQSLLEKDPFANPVGDVPMLWNSTVWQRMSDYKSRDRVQVLTLWESSGSSVSLQAGRRGDPSLQWTSRWMNRGGSTKGLLDQLFSVSLTGAGNKLRSLSRPANAQDASAKQITMGPVAAAK